MVVLRLTQIDPLALNRARPPPPHSRRPRVLPHPPRHHPLPRPRLLLRRHLLPCPPRHEHAFRFVRLFRKGDFGPQDVSLEVGPDGGGGRCGVVDQEGRGGGVEGRGGEDEDVVQDAALCVREVVSLLCWCREVSQCGDWWRAAKAIR